MNNLSHDTYIHACIQNVIPGNMCPRGNSEMIIDVKEQIWLPNGNVCVSHLMLNRY